MWLLVSLAIVVLFDFVRAHSRSIMKCVLPLRTGVKISTCRAQTGPTTSLLAPTWFLHKYSRLRTAFSTWLRPANSPYNVCPLRSAMINNHALYSTSLQLWAATRVALRHTLSQFYILVLYLQNGVRKVSLLLNYTVKIKWSLSNENVRMTRHLSYTHTIGVEWKSENPLQKSWQRYQQTCLKTP